MTIIELYSTSIQALINMKNLRNRIKSEITKVTLDIINVQKSRTLLMLHTKLCKKTGD